MTVHSSDSCIMSLVSLDLISRQVPWFKTVQCVQCTRLKTATSRTEEHSTQAKASSLPAFLLRGWVKIPPPPAALFPIFGGNVGIQRPRFPGTRGGTEEMGERPGGGASLF